MLTLIFYHQKSTTFAISRNMLLALGIALKIYTSMAKGLKLKVRKFLGLLPMFVEVTGEKLIRGRSGGLSASIVRNWNVYLFLD